MTPSYDDLTQTVFTLGTIFTKMVISHIEDGDDRIEPAIERCLDALALAALDDEFIEAPRGRDIVLGVTSMVSLVGEGLVELQEEVGFERILVVAE